jgi:hypothetical protein
MQSSLLLAKGERLTLAGIIGRLDVSTARLVALSACETGLTDVRASPDEYLGLPTEFLRRGTPGVMSSLWAVSDFSTMLLMHRFYRAHFRDGLDPASSLRAAQCWLRDATNAELAEVLAQRRAAMRGGAGPALEQRYRAVAVAVERKIINARLIGTSHEVVLDFKPHERGPCKDVADWGYIATGHAGSSEPATDGSYNSWFSALTKGKSATRTSPS